MAAARDAEERGERAGPLDGFYRTLMNGTLLLPVPPDHGEEAKAALASAINDASEVEISVMLARDGDGEPVSVVLRVERRAGRMGAAGTAACRFPARIAVANLARRGPAGDHGSGRTDPVSLRDPTSSLALADGRLPGTDAPLFGPAARRSVRLRLPGAAASPSSGRCAAALDGSRVGEAYSSSLGVGRGRQRLLLGLVGDAGAAVTVDVPDGTDVVWLEEPLLGSVRAVAEPFFRAPRARARR